MNKKTIWIALVLIAIIIIALAGNRKTSNNKVKIGVITALTGDVAYWGESTRIGADLAKIDLAKEGIEVDFILDDAQLDPKLALNAAQKQVNIDKVSGIFSEFNPAAIAVTSFVKGKGILHVYNAAPVSPLKDDENTYKTFTDFQVGCQKSAVLLKSKGLTRIGVLKNNLEFGQLCTDGVKSVFGSSTIEETYNPGTTDFRTMLTKLKSQGAQAIINASFSTDQITILKNMRTLGIKIPFIGTTDLDTPEVIKDNENLLAGVTVFGLPVVSADFVSKVRATFPGRTITNEQAAGLAYTHLKQMAKALHVCGQDASCIRNKMDNVSSEPSIGFHGFKNHIADFDILIDEFKDGKFVKIQ